MLREWRGRMSCLRSGGKQKAVVVESVLDITFQTCSWHNATRELYKFFGPRKERRTKLDATVGRFNVQKLVILFGKFVSLQRPQECLKRSH
jgi:hypothetical protein